MNRAKIFVVLAAYNEAAHIQDVVRRCRKQGFSKVVVVDDGSRDNTALLARKAGAVVLQHIVNLGKGAAMKTGADFAVQEGAGGIVFMDSDGQHLPEELPLFAAQLGKGYDIVFGVRRRTQKMPLIRRLGNWLITTTVRVAYKMDLRDVMSGYRAMTVRAYKKVRWASRDYSVEGEMIAYAGKSNLRYAQFEIATIYHDKYKGMNIFDGLRLLWQLIWCRITHKDNTIR